MTMDLPTRTGRTFFPRFWAAFGVAMAVLSVALVPAAPATEVPAREVRFQAHDGHMLSADYYAPREPNAPAPLVILLHMYGRDRTTFAPLIGPLRAAGFAVLALDLRGHGKSATPETKRRMEQRDPKLFEDMYEDVRGAYDWLAQQPGVDRSRFALVGASVGCSVALRYARQDRSVDAIVCLSPGLKYLGVDSEADAPMIGGRHVLLIAAEKEREACEKLKPLIAGSEVRIYPGEAHATNLFAGVADLPATITDFLKAGVGKPATSPVYSSVQSDVYHLPGSRWIQEIKQTNLRVFSSGEEAMERGVRPAHTDGPPTNNGG
jgi:pimeloyl-ACP methyl ester carboxylesterase